MTHSDKTSADKTSIGFEFQDLVYIEKLIGLRRGQTLGLEVHDDIHIETATNNGLIENITLIQVKHSINAKNITDRDIDLWKTLYNWTKIVPELPSHRSIKLQIYTNKSLNNQELISLLNSAQKNIPEVLKHIKEAHKEISLAESKKKGNASPNPIAVYVKSVAEADEKTLESILKNLELHPDNSEILSKISEALDQLAVPPSLWEETRKYIIGAFKESKFSKVTSGQKITISFEDFREEMGFNRIIRSARATPADFDKFIDIYYEYQRPDKLSFQSSVFHDQLKDIGIQEEEIITRGIEMMLAESFIESLQEAGSFSSIENTRLENNAVSEWDSRHKQAHRDTDENIKLEHIKASKLCYDQTMQASLFFGEKNLPTNLRCGKYIKLSNTLRIGWLKNWRSIYKK